MKKIIVYGAGLVLVVIAILWFTGILGVRIPGVYTQLEETYRDALNQHVRAVRQQKTEIIDLNKAVSKADSLRNESEKKLAFAKQEIEALNVKLKNARYFTTVETKTTDTFRVVLVDTVYLGDSVPFRHARYSDNYLHQYIRLNAQNSELFVDYSITDTIMVVDSWVRKPNKKGEQVFILWRWVRPWQVKVDVKSKNPKSTITNSERLILKERK